MKWFGEPWGAPFCTGKYRVQVPDAPCAYCKQPFAYDHKGVVVPFLGAAHDPPELAYHLDCLAITLGLITVHILDGGLPLCRFSQTYPGEWPEGHKWTSLQDWKDATCRPCLRGRQPDA